MWAATHDRSRADIVATRVGQGFGALAIGMIVAFAVTLPDVPVFAVTVILLAVAILLPLLLFPFTNTLWMAFDLLSHRPDERELAEAAASVEAAVATAD